MKMKRQCVLFLVGAPGVGKTTLVREILSGSRLELIAKPKWTLAGSDACAAGHYMGAPFDGADTIPYNGAAAFDYWQEHLSVRALTILDGDRFSNSTALAWWVDVGVRVCCARLVLLESEAQARRDARGSAQNPSWVKGRTTKAARFADKLDCSRTFDATCKPRALAAQVLHWVYSL